MTALEALKNSVGYAVSIKAIEAIAIERGFDVLDSVFTSDIAQSKSYQLCKADILRYLTTTANISEGGVSISMTEKDLLKNTANAIYSQYGEPLIGIAHTPTVQYIED